MLYGSVGRVGLRSSVAPFSPAQLFAAGEQGAWYDPSDFSTMFQDAAGTTPVTAVEQPVGRILDKSGRGNHATQSTSASRPVLSARVNLLTRTEEFDDAAWLKQSQGDGITPTVTPNAGLAPDGTMTADRLQVSRLTSGSPNRSQIRQSVSPALTSPFPNVTARIWYKSYDGTNQQFSIVNSAYSVGNVALTATSEWQVATVNFTGGLANPNMWVGLHDALTTNLSADILIWGADLRPANAGVNLPVYQRVVTATDYDTNGFPYYLRFDGTDDSMATGTINPGSVDKAQVFAGVRKLSDSALGEIIGLTADPGTTSGAVALVASSATGDASRRTYGASLLGTTGGSSNVAIASVGLVASPNTNIVTALLDTAASGTNNQVAMRLNGVAGNYANNGQTASTGNLANAPLYIGRRGGTSSPFNGHLYSLIVRFSATNLPAATIAQTETWVNGKTYAY